MPPADKFSLLLTAFNSVNDICNKPHTVCQTPSDKCNNIVTVPACFLTKPLSEVCSLDRVTYLLNANDSMALVACTTSVCFVA